MPVVGTYTKNYHWPRSAFRLYYDTLSGQKLKPKGSGQTTYSSEYGASSGYYSTIGEWHGLDSTSCLAAIQSIHNVSGSYAWAYNTAYNRAYAKLMAKVSDRAQNLTALAEIDKSFEMIFKRATSMREAYSALKRGNLRSALNLLSVQEPLRKHRRTKWTNPRDASALWLEYWFGWAPMLNDMFTSLMILYNLSPFRDEIIEGKGTVLWNRPFREDKAPGVYNTEQFDGKTSVRLSTRVIVSNPNLFLAQRLGLMNPAETALELIPFSWLLNWVSNLGQYVSSWSDDYGLTFQDTFETVYSRASGSQHWSRSYGVERDGFGFEFHKCSRRGVGPLRKPRLVWDLPNGLAQTRAATAVSLLTLLFSPDGASKIPRKI